MIESYKIQDVGTALDGRQENYWDGHLKPKYEKYRPGFTFKFKSPEKTIGEHDFRALEFGHWSTQNERFDFLAAADVSFFDMQKVTKIKKLGFKKIGVAFGARGKGGAALAHFEPTTFMINLTRNKGLGAFAHEYGHAIDYLYGGYIDQIPGCFSLSGGQSLATRPQDHTQGTARYYMDLVLQSIIWDGKMQSDSYEAFKKIGGTYWIERTELFARAFEQWVHFQLAKKGIQNIFLTNSKYTNNAYLQPNDFKRVLPQMNKLISKLASLSKA